VRLARWFGRFARRIARLVGHPLTFCGAVASIIVWLACGPLFGFSEVWQLVINTGTTIVTFLIVFLIQQTQNVDTDAIHLKLNELLRASEASSAFINLEDLPEDQLCDLKKAFDAEAQRARKGG
jgi:low affinity Fe/Cu permease